VATLDHLILHVNDLAASIAFYTEVLGFSDEGRDGPFAVIRVGPDCQLLLVPNGAPGFEHYAFAVTSAEFNAIFRRIKAAGIAFGPTYDAVGANTDAGFEAGARGMAPTLYFNDPNKHLLEIRTYDKDPATAPATSPPSLVATVESFPEKN
jgi:catechol 2,3-dioxygenase-like lactoylglutathione lyase family enzyme